MGDLAIYSLAASVIVSVIILCWADRREGWRQGVEFARRIADADANRYRMLHNNAWQEGRIDLANCINGQVEALRSLECKLRWEMAARFMKREDPGLE